jgi:hypothetical protein
MSITRVLSFLLPVALVCASVAHAADEAQKPLRAGMVGLDTSHAIAFTDVFNGPNPPPEVAGIRVTIAFPAGSDDLPSSKSRVGEYTEKLKGKGVEIAASMSDLLSKCDVVLIESVDGRRHLELAKPVFEAGKPVFIDKPLAASLADGMEIAELGKKHNVPWFSASALRFSPSIAEAAHDPKIGDVLGCDALSPCSLDPTHPDLFWYGVHGVETLYTIMGPGCISVTRTTTPGADAVTGLWKGERIGTFRGIRKGVADYGAMVYGSKSNAPTGGYAGYEPLVVEIGKFFRTGKPPVTVDEELEVLAFMEAADESKHQGGKPVTLESVMQKAKEKLSKK